MLITGQFHEERFESQLELHLRKTEFFESKREFQNAPQLFDIYALFETSWVIPVLPTMTSST